MVSEWSNIVNFALYLAVTLPLMLVGLVVFSFTTPYKEFKMIAEGSNPEDHVKSAAASAAAHDLGGKVLGLAIVLASAIYHSVSVFDLLVWGLIGIAVEVGVFYLFELLTPFKIVQEIPKGNVAVGIFSSRICIATGVLLAALMSY